MLNKKRFRDICSPSYLHTIGLALLMGLLLPATVFAVPTVTIDSPQDGAIIDNDHTVVTGIASAVGAGIGIDLMLVIDDSGSLADTDPTKERFEAVQQLLNSFGTNANVQIGLVFFSETASLEAPLQTVSAAKSAITQAISTHQTPAGNTAIGDGIETASEELTTNGRSDSSHIILVFTDGENNRGVDPNQAATQTLDKGQILHVIGLFQTNQTSSVGAEAAEAIAQAGGGLLFIATNPTELVALFRDAKIVNIESVAVTNTTTGQTANNVDLIVGNYNASIDLIDGQNVLEVLATDTDGETATASVTVTGSTQQIDPCDSNHYATGCPAYRSVKLRPQVLMAGIDPMLVDITDDSFKVVAVVREGIAAIKHVQLSENTGSFSMGMTLEGQLANGDQIYSLTFVGMRGVLYQQELPNLFGSKIGEYHITVIDQAEQRHSFPDFEFGNNVEFETQTPASSAQPYTTTGIRRLQPQAIMAGFDPILIDYSDSSFKIKAIVRPGLADIKHVTLKNGSGFAIEMNREGEGDWDGDIGNGDLMYSAVYTFPSGAFPAGALRDLFGTEHPEG